MAHNFRAANAEPARSAPRLEQHPLAPASPLREKAPTVISEPQPMAVNKVPPRKPPVVCPPAAADDAEVREDTVMALEGLFSKDKNIVEYSEEDYVAKTRELLTRKGFVVPTDSKIRGDIGWFRCHQGDLSSRLTHWIREMPLAASDPIAVIRSVATDVSCCHVFMSYSFSNSFGQRIVGGYDPSYLPSPTTEAIINNAEEGVAAAHLIVGASGSGKTMSLVGFGRQRGRGLCSPCFSSRETSAKCCSIAGRVLTEG